MKKITTLIALMLMAGFAVAQETPTAEEKEMKEAREALEALESKEQQEHLEHKDQQEHKEHMRLSEGGDTTRLKWGSSKIIIVNDEDEKDENECDDCIDKGALTHWAGIDLGVNGYGGSSDVFNVPNAAENFEVDYARSINLSINFWEERIGIAKEYVGIVTGAGFNFASYQFKNNVVLASNKDTTFAFEDTLISYDKNRLKAVYLQVPLMLAFNTSSDPSKSFHLAGGVIGAYRIGSKFKQKYKFEGEKHKSKTKGHYNLNPIKLSATARVGYGNLTLFFNYGLTTLFEDNKAPNIYPFEAGITLVGF